MTLQRSDLSLLLVFLTCVCLIQKSNALSLLERLNGLDGNETTTSATETSTSAAHTCTANSTVLNNFSVLKEIRKVGATCRHHCSSDGGNAHSRELGEFSRKLQLLQMTVEGLALMLDEAIQQIEEPFARRYQVKCI